MNHKTNFALVGILFLSLFVNAQAPAPKELPARRTTQAIKIDGLINEAAWKEAPLMTNLVEFRPKMGAVEANDVRTEAYLLYDDLGIYFGGFCTKEQRTASPANYPGAMVLALMIM